ncbi:hypothetical protein HOE04_02075 [archaeon]|jgi:hypothetical protein|nr:hypothetical protein [archaeon]
MNKWQGKKDIGQEIIENLEYINSSLKKNSQIHFMIDTDTLNRMKDRAKNENISLSEWCRKKLREDSQLQRIEDKLDKIITKG